MDRAALRTSDADRERAVALLQVHAEAGRLTVEELDERCSRAFSAKTFGELDALTVDLPPVPAPQRARPAPTPVRRPKLPGTTYFADTWRAPVPPEVAMEDLLAYVAPPLRRSGYELREHTPHRLVFVRTRRPVWTFAVAILVFPLGLIALVHKTDERIAIDLQPARGGTLVAAGGVAPLAVRRAFAELEA